MHRTSFLITLAFLAFAGTCVRAENATDKFLGTFTGRPMRHHNGPFAEGIVEQLEVTQNGGKLKLEATMNAMNFEAGMDHVSNTVWYFTGIGKLVRGSIQFTYEARFAGGRSTNTGRGVFRPSGHRFVLTVDDGEYIVRRKKT